MPVVRFTGLDKSLISKIVNGYTASPKPATLEKIAVALKVELGELTRIFAQSPPHPNSATVPQAQEPSEIEKATFDNSIYSAMGARFLKNSVSSETLHNLWQSLVSLATALQKTHASDDKD
ncbi:MAG: helix-turn-helix domain-containing protein [Tolypothrix carrinoi HA7290-LM1]|jgi:transcriptional regulator with XRE-family HTH domain|nr:helix-turn-helix domain-containing protein [Tolypothrix carrinoi HA7290-LM1]